MGFSEKKFLSQISGFEKSTRMLSIQGVDLCNKRLRKKLGFSEKHFIVLKLALFQRSESVLAPNSPTAVLGKSLNHESSVEILVKSNVDETDFITNNSNFRFG